jgi:cell division protein FtsI (penicillin-binding protein 3)
MSASVVNRRIRLLLTLLALVFAGTLARAVWLQAVHAAPLARLAQVQHRESTTIPARRGTLYDRNAVELALGAQATTIYADPALVRRPKAIADAAERILGVDGADLLPSLVDRRRRFVYVQRKAPPEKAAALERLKLAGLGFYSEERRSYPLGPVAAQVLGYAGADNRGLSGLEYSLDRVLAGKAGEETVIRDPAGRVVEVVSSVDEVPGRDVFLTLDHHIQSNAELVLRNTVARWGARSASAVVLDPRTGEVLAMAVAPTYDANRSPQTALDRQRNRAVTDTYEPGSTFKLITVAGALSERLVSPGSLFTLAPSIRVADRVIHEAHTRGTERMTVAQILYESSNIGTITLAQLLGKERLAKWIERFGFGRRTGIDFPGETRGIVLPPERWSGSTIGNVPLGQGIAVTPVQMAAAYAATANRGVWVEPHLIDHVAQGGLHVPVRRRVLSRTVADQLMTMFGDVVVEGTGQLAAVEGYRVAGKTGTAAKPDSTGGYSTYRYVASFVGMVPASRPRLVILVTVDEPRGAIWGGVVAAPAFAEIAKFDLQYLEVPPDAATGETSQG